MTDDETRVTFSNADYDAIEAAVMETARGRWFLREFARRNRNADTEAVLAALGRIEKTAHDDAAGRTLDQVRSTLQDMARTISRTKGELGLLPRGKGQDDLRNLLDLEAQEPLSDEEFQALAEQRIRRIIQTLRYLEGRIHEVAAVCAPDQPAPDKESSFPEAPGLADEQTLHPGPYPSFLM
ncbi:hypothetical protein ACFOYU_24225 [Microvirga sp. GCM10011540]|uniref:hypothetical protein n=1 Tax=Microvirga sp. GCM10011540 TaxID=3317338 RepID=UPI003616C712